MSTAIDTRAGVTDVGEPPGRLALVRQAPGDTIVDLTATDSAGTEVVVHLDRRQLLELMAACGAAAHTM